MIPRSELTSMIKKTGQKGNQVIAEILLDNRDLLAGIKEQLNLLTLAIEKTTQ